MTSRCLGPTHLRTASKTVAIKRDVDVYSNKERNECADWTTCLHRFDIQGKGILSRSINPHIKGIVMNCCVTLWKSQLRDFSLFSFTYFNKFFYYINSLYTKDPRVTDATECRKMPIPHRRNLRGLREIHASTFLTATKISWALSATRSRT